MHSIPEPVVVEAQPTTRRLIPIHEVMRLTSLSASGIARKVRFEDFPKPVILGKRRHAWVESEILDWIESKIEQREGEDTREE